MTRVRRLGALEALHRVNEPREPAQLSILPGGTARRLRKAVVVLFSGDGLSGLMATTAVVVYLWNRRLPASLHLRDTTRLRAHRTPGSEADELMGIGV